jgi:hypothetical protein
MRKEVVQNQEFLARISELEVTIADAAEDKYRM